MKKIKVTTEGTNYSAMDLGEFEGLMEYSYLHPKLNQEVKGKVFVGELLKATGVEISFQILRPDTAIPFIHKHNLHEEVYIILKGSGQFQVDQQCFNVKEGSIVRIAPEGERTLRNNSIAPLIFMVIQSQAGSLDQHFIFDGYRVKRKIAWDD
jgi:mannose-6-phosphate isomerase-like protein (cupin superfamily)